MIAHAGHKASTVKNRRHMVQERPFSIRLIHGLILLLIIACLISGYKAFDGGWSGIGIVNRPTYFIVHQTSGIILTILLPMLWLVGMIDMLRKLRALPIISQKIRHIAIFIIHMILLLLAAAIAFTGWAAASKIFLFGVVEWPRIWPEAGPLEIVRLYAIHKMLIPPFLIFLFVHIAASLFHQWILKDRLMTAMFGRQRKNDR